MAVPKLGIFWIISDEIVSFAVPLDRAEHDGIFANYPHGHVQIWPLVARSNPQLRQTGYEFIPRGRVTYDIERRSFHLLLPHSLLRDDETVKRLIARFELPLENVRLIADQHYDPPESL